MLIVVARSAVIGSLCGLEFSPMVTGMVNAQTPTVACCFAET
jgi:hypothetical protein